MEHLALGLQPIESLGHLLRLHQSIGPMEKQRVQIVGMQAAQAVIHRVKNMLLGKVKVAGADAAFALHPHLPPQGGILFQYPAEQLLRPAAAVNIRVIEIGHAAVQGGAHEGIRLPNIQLRQVHTAQGDGRDLQAVLAAHLQCFLHSNDSFLSRNRGIVPISLAKFPSLAGKA